MCSPPVVSPSKFTAPADGYTLHSYTINADGRIASFVLRTCADATPVTLQFKNCFGYLETFHCFGNSITELKPTRSSASFLGKTRNYRVFAIPETTAHTGVISPDLFDMFADLCASTSVSVLPSDREICITDCDFKLSNDRYEPQQATITWREAARTALHQPTETVRTFDESFDNTFY